MPIPVSEDKRNNGAFTANQDVLAAMLDFATRMGLELDQPITDGTLTRCAVVGKPGRRDGAYIIHLDPPTSIWCQNHVTGEMETWTPLARSGMTDEERAALQERIEKDRQARESAKSTRQALASIKANTIYQDARLDPAGHPYAQKKKLPFPESIRRGKWPQRKWPDAILVPLYDEDGQIRTLQAINSDGSKDLLAGGKKRGCFFPFGKIRDAERVLIGEGLATVAAGCLATKLPGVMAIDAGNLLTVGRIVRNIAGPNADIIFLADDDQGGVRA
jgi:putative DNA primase/helicase